MKPQTGAFLEKARALLRQADVMIEVGLTDAAGRTAYLAGFHAAQALIFERTGKIARRHFQRLGRGSVRPGFRREALGETLQRVNCPW